MTKRYVRSEREEGKECGREEGRERGSEIEPSAVAEFGVSHTSHDTSSWQAANRSGQLSAVQVSLGQSS